MEHLNEIATVFLCIVGGIYSIFLLCDCHVRRKVRLRAERSATRTSHTKCGTRSTHMDWWSQVTSATIFLAVAVILLVMAQRDSRAVRNAAGSQEPDLASSVQVPGLLAVPASRIHRAGGRPGQPIMYADLAYLSVGDVEIHALAKEGAEIWFLGLTATDITDEGVSHLKRMPHLSQLSLERTPVTDSGCQDLAQVVLLEHLSLSDTAITDAGLKSLQNLRRLEFLDIGETHVTDRGVKRLQKALPNCKITR